MKKLRVGVAEQWLFMLVLAATLLRFALMYFNWPTTTSDESVIDLMALHINTKGEFPTFFYGQHYMGALEAYLGALGSHLFGPSTFSVRLGLLLLFDLYLICMYYLTCLLYSKIFALVTVSLLSVGSSLILTQQLRAIGGYAEIMVCGAVIYLLTAWLLLTSYSAQQRYSLKQQQQRILLYGLLGLVMGFAFYSDQLIFSCIATSGLFLLLFCWQDFLHWAGVCFLLGLFIGSLPLLIYNLNAAPGEDSLHVLLELEQLGTNSSHLPFAQHIIGALMIALPAETGYNPLCDDKEYLPQLRSVGELFAKGRQFQCIVEYGGTSLGISLLWVIALLLALLPIWRQWRHVPAKLWSYEQRQLMMLHVARSLLLMGAAVAFGLYVLSPSSAFQPLGTVRYLMCLLLATPAVLWPVWRGIDTCATGSTFKKWQMSLGFTCRMGILSCLVMASVQGTIQVVVDIPAAQRAYAQQEILIQQLLHLGATRIYSDYDTCFPLIFQSHEQIICSDLVVEGQQLQLGLNRYPPYLNLVRFIPHPTYLYRLNSPAVTMLDQGKYRLDQHYQRLRYNGYIIYLYASSPRDYQCLITVRSYADTVDRCLHQLG